MKLMPIFRSFGTVSSVLRSSTICKCPHSHVCSLHGLMNWLCQCINCGNMDKGLHQDIRAVQAVLVSQ